MLRVWLVSLGLVAPLVLGFGVARAQTPSPTMAAAVPEPVSELIQMILARDLDGLLGAVEFTPLGCVKTPTIGSPPQCSAGEPEGTPVDSFPVGYCEGAYVTTMEDVRRTFEAALSLAPMSLYAVVRNDRSVSGGVDYTVAVTWGSVPSPDAPGRWWHVTRAGRITGLSFGCGFPPMERWLNLSGMSPQYVAGPFSGQCSLRRLDPLVASIDVYRGTGYVDEVVEGRPVSASVAGILVDDATGEPMGEVVRVRFDANTRLDGRTLVPQIAPQTGATIDALTQMLGRLNPERTMRVQVMGRRLGGCLIFATDMTTYASSLPAPTLPALPRTGDGGGAAGEGPPLVLTGLGPGLLALVLALWAVRRQRRVD